MQQLSAPCTRQGKSAMWSRQLIPRHLHRVCIQASKKPSWGPLYLPPGASISMSSVDLADSLPEQHTSAQERKRALVQDALKQGNLGLSFSAGGFLYCYHLGVLWELARLGILPPPGDPGAIKMAGSSAGSLAIVTYACGLDVNKASEALFAFAADCRNNGTRGRLGVLLRDFLHEYLPDDAHERCRDLTYVHITRVFPVWQPEVISQFHDKADLVEALATSCHIPVYADGKWMTKFRGRYYMDGGATAFIPHVPKMPVSVKVCCFPVNEMISRVQPSLEGYARIASLLDVAISPDKFESWPHSYAQLVQWALVPADDETLKYLVTKGRRDALAWATSLRLVSDPEGGDKEQVIVQTDGGRSEQVTQPVDADMALAEAGRKAQ